MNEIEFTNPNDIPQPPSNVELEEISAELYPDHKRLRVMIKLTPFQKKPSAKVTIKDPEGHLVKSAHLVQILDPISEITIHLPQQIPTGTYQLLVRAYYLVEKDLDSEGKERVKLIENFIGELDSSLIIP